MFCCPDKEFQHQSKLKYVFFVFYLFLAQSFHAEDKKNKHCFLYQESNLRSKCSQQVCWAGVERRNTGPTNTSTHHLDSEPEDVRTVNLVSLQGDQEYQEDPNHASDSPEERCTAMRSGLAAGDQRCRGDVWLEAFPLYICSSRGLQEMDLFFLYWAGIPVPFIIPTLQL